MGVTNSASGNMMNGDSFDCGSFHHDVAEERFGERYLGRNLLTLAILRPVPIEAAVLKAAAKN